MSLSRPVPVSPEDPNPAEEPALNTVPPAPIPATRSLVPIPRASLPGFPLLRTGAGATAGRH